MKTLYYPNTYSMFDTGVLAKKLEKMSKKGWHFKEIIPYFLVFEKGEPMEIAYSTAFFPNNSVLEPTLTPEHESYLDLCEQQGWELIWTHGTRQIFRNKRPCPILIDTDPMIQLQTLGASMGRYLFYNLAPLIICLPLLFLFAQEYKIWGTLDEWFQTWEMKLMIAVFWVPAAFGLLKILWYFIWFFRSHARIEKGKTMLPTLFHIRRGMDMISLSLIVALFITALGPGKTAAYCIIALPLEVLWWRIFRRFKARFKSKETVYLFAILSQKIIFDIVGEFALRLLDYFPS